MKSFIKYILRSIAKLPLVGRVMHIFYALYQLPTLRSDFQELSSLVLDINHLVKIELPTLRSDFQELKSLVLDINHLVKIELPARIEDRSLASAQVSSLLNTVSEINGRLLNLETSVPVALRKITRDSVSFQKDSLNGLTDSVGYLLRRVEFVRQELMFEMRYGAARSEKADETVSVEIVANDKLEKMRSDGCIRINVGCGHVPIDGYLNIDRRKIPFVDIVAAGDNLPFDSEELSEIFSAHFLEHFPHEKLVRSILPYYFSLLKQGGIFRAIVPDAEAMIDAFKSREYSFDRLREVTFGAQDYDGDFHYTMMSPESMTDLLENAGFQEIVVVARNRENGGCKEFEIIAKRA